MLRKPASQTGLAGTSHTDQGNAATIMCCGKILVQQLQGEVLLLAVQTLYQLIDQNLLGGDFITSLQQVGNICSQCLCHSL